MNKNGKETVLTAYIVLITIVLVGGFLTYKISTPTGLIPTDVEAAISNIDSFEAVFDPDGTTSIKFSVSAKENINLGLTSNFLLSFETSGNVVNFEGNAFFDGAFGEIQSVKMVDETGEVVLKDATGTIVVTNTIDNKAIVLVKLDFTRPKDKEIFVPPRKLLITFDFNSYDRRFESKVMPIRHSEKPIPFPYYLNNFDIVEIKV
ncbi:hypothetical protein KY333_02145 [Candidatus Woesearchaeota archaeon]|nr:hypothetical protein [Candidatus Woesearchaeota archaeon]